ncbi:helix-turn-helix transcriptional regulator [Paenibacillus etheri]|uniref:Helix-turn-helix transcriptional regulator n=1 Tax=Paenibacillus etheri TaxID=1306852 RepID=A0A0W1AZV9_9BACL|nr:helix-turn-helix transcriptional regulator [Paenibacillus etheri]KTD86845.1 helix-turn-helix transcriptional regulator [Paenibacillus etheri]
MNTHKQFILIKKQIIKLGMVTDSSHNYRTSLLSLLREAVPFDAACCTHVDPQTLLSTGAVTEDNVESIHPHLFQIEYGEDDVNTYEQMVNSKLLVATIYEATGQQPERSARYRKVLYPAGFGDELRAVLILGESCWGYLTLYRNADQSEFLQEECDWITSIITLIAARMRAFSLELPERDEAWLEDHYGSGIAVLSDHLTLLSSNPTADRWLDKLRSLERIDAQVLPRPIRAVSTQALNSPSESVGIAKACIRMTEGPYLVVRASRLRSSDGQTQVAISFEPARPADMLPIIAEAYNLTEREQQLLHGVIRGLSTKELASALHISAYTVQDHLKSIFSKSGVSSRRELIWYLHSRYNIIDP